eukprot:8605014-Lingulodinium_polyedra.AAC.1
MLPPTPTGMLALAAEASTRSAEAAARASELWTLAVDRADAVARRDLRAPAAAGAGPQPRPVPRGS